MRFVLGLFLVLCAQAASAAPSDPIEVPRLAEREEVVRHFVAATELVASLSRSAEARQLAQLAREGSALYGPYPDSTGQGRPLIQMVRHGQPGVTRVPLIVLLPGDEALSPAWKEKLVGTHNAEFLPDPGVIILTAGWAGSDNPVYMGLVGQHTLFSFRHGRAHATDRSALLEIERQAYLHEVDLLSQLGGEPYHLVLQKEVLRVASRAQLLHDGYWYPQATVYAQYTTALDKVFHGAPHSALEARSRAALVFLHAMFTFLQLKDPRAAAANQLDLVASLNPQ